MDEDNRSEVFRTDSSFSLDMTNQLFPNIFRLLLLHQSGLLDHAFKKVSATSNPCLLGKKMVHNDTKTEIMMKLPDFVGIFIAMAAGITLSFVTLVCEWATKFIQLKTSVLNLNS